MKILTINPGSTSTKIAVFNNLESVFEKTLRHSVDELADFQNITDQFEFRRNIILDCLKEENISVDSFDAIAGRGGMLKSIPGGVYRVNQVMIEDLKKGVQGEHASNLGGILAERLLRKQSILKMLLSWILLLLTRWKILPAIPGFRICQE